MKQEEGQKHMISGAFGWRTGEAPSGSSDVSRRVDNRP